jgi:DNA/RNA endonuclease G (NUC1)
MFKLRSKRPTTVKETASRQTSVTHCHFSYIYLRNKQTKFPMYTAQDVRGTYRESENRSARDFSRHSLFGVSLV